MEAYQWLFAEVLIKQFNNILTRYWYQYHVQRYLKYGDSASKKKLKEHTNAINWLLHERRDSLCFRVLKIEWLSDEQVLRAISKKFNGERKFMKIIKDFTEGL